MGANLTPATDWLHGFGQGDGEESSGTIDRADEWYLREPKGRRQHAASGNQNWGG